MLRNSVMSVLGFVSESWTSRRWGLVPFGVRITLEKVGRLYIIVGLLIYTLVRSNVYSMPAVGVALPRGASENK